MLFIRKKKQQIKTTKTTSLSNLQVPYLSNKLCTSQESCRTLPVVNFTFCFTKNSCLEDSLVFSSFFFPDLLWGMKNPLQYRYVTFVFITIQHKLQQTHPQILRPTTGNKFNLFYI